MSPSFSVLFNIDLKCLLHVYLHFGQFNQTYSNIGEASLQSPFSTPVKNKKHFTDLPFATHLGFSQTITTDIGWRWTKWERSANKITQRKF